jgi:Protein of unknown function (DUF1360)
LLLLLYVFASFGLAFVLGYAKISLPLRKFLARAAQPYEGPDLGGRVFSLVARWLLALLECPACVAFWLGLASVMTPFVDGIPLHGISWVMIAPFLGLANTGAVLAVGMFTGFIRTE